MVSTDMCYSTVYSMYVCPWCVRLSVAHRCVYSMPHIAKSVLSLHKLGLSFRTSVHISRATVGAVGSVPVGSVPAGSALAAQAHRGIESTRSMMRPAFDTDLPPVDTDESSGRGASARANFESTGVTEKVRDD